VTTIDQHTEDFGLVSAQLLVERMTGRGPDAPVTRLIQPSLVLRGSSGPPYSATARTRATSLAAPLPTPAEAPA
jgi:hypothetical protein